MIPILFSLFVLAIVYQLYFLIFIFAKLNRYETPGFEESVNNDGISVIVCAWNEIENLKELIPLLDNQNYPDFEVIIVDDRSVDGSYDYLLANCHLFKNVRFLRIEHTPEHLSAKKYALTLGIRSAKYDILLLTDADCRPQSESWISGMKACLSQEKEIVLGFSPYYKTKGFLNRLIQYETFVTALQYFSFALSGMPYMGVGRNLMYRKEIFTRNRGFAQHTNIIGGDDDLFMNDVATGENTAVCLNPDTFVYSFPKLDWQAWYRQKIRHISVSKYYRKKNKFLLGSLATSQMLVWMLFLGLIGFLIYDVLVFWLIGLFLLRLISQWIIFSKASQNLNQIIKTKSIPVFDFMFTIYYLIMGFWSFVFRKKKIKWR